MKKGFLLILGIVGLLGILGGVWVLSKGPRTRDSVTVRGRDQGEKGDQVLQAREEVGLKVKITSSAFKNNDEIPGQYTCEGDDINPPLRISGVPEGTGSLALIMDDPDAPMGTWDHWLVFNIEPTVREIAENSVPEGGVEVINSFGKKEYGGPCPPPGPAHRYFFKVYALDSKLDPAAISDKKSLLAAMEGHVLASGELVGIYSR